MMMEYFEKLKDIYMGFCDMGKGSLPRHASESSMLFAVR